jgi:hypothetical protein
MHDVEEAVVQNKAWAIIASAYSSCLRSVLVFDDEITLVNPNATAKLNAAVIATDSTYASNGTITAYVAEARSENA